MVTNNPLSEIGKQIMWNRLIAIVEEQAQTLIRCSFSTTVREAGDLSAGIFDPKGRMLAQAVTGTPGHVNSMATAVLHFLAEYPIETMSEGDSFITNDPWLTSGHLHDITVVTPAFHRGKPIALFAATIHVVDVGGRGLGIDGRQIYEEGISIPIMHLARKGEMNADLLKILRVNNREPIQVEGDVYSCAAAGEEGCRRLVEMMDEFEIDGLADLAEHIIDNSRAAMLRAIQALPRGTFRNEVTIDGYEAPVTVKATLTISDEGIHVDYAGSSPPSRYAINVVLNYTTAYTCFGARCCIAPDVPNNYGSMAVITASAPVGCILNVQRPAPVAARHIVGHQTADAVIGCLHQAMKGGLQAESGGGWNPMLRGDAWFGGVDRVWENYLFYSGGMGARPNKDGLTTTQFPSGVRIISIEAAESVVPVLFWRKELLTDSGGPGEFRGGLSQALEIGPAIDGPISVQAMFDRVDHPPRGREGGLSGRGGRVLSLKHSRTLPAKGQHTINPDDVLRLELPGGGGVGTPHRRRPDAVVEDVAQGYVSAEAARDVYRVILAKDGSLDTAATARRRAAVPVPAGSSR